MVEKISGITKIQGINYYDANSQSFGDTLKKKQAMGFQRVLERKLREKSNSISDAFTVDFKKNPR